jgi:tetratricopeptide (TPR) repeat protein
MKKNLTLLAALFLILTSTHARYSETEALKKYHEANITYQKLDYERSIKLYEDLISNNYKSSEIYYNLGNAYFKTGNVPKAILYYERTKKLKPDDEDTNFNLKIASLKVVDKIESVPQIFYKRWANRLALIISANGWAITFIITVWLLFAASALYVMAKTVITKKISFLLIIIFLCLTASTGVIAAKSHSLSHVDQQAIIMSSSVYIKSSPDDKGNDVFILHEGTKADVMDEIGEWRKIRIANGSVGWMKASDMEII